MPLRPRYILFVTIVGTLLLLLCFQNQIAEGFAAEKEPSEHPLSLAQKLLQQSLVPIRKVAKYALDKDMIMERFQQAFKSPMELARDYAKATGQGKTKT